MLFFFLIADNNGTLYNGTTFVNATLMSVSVAHFPVVLVWNVDGLYIYTIVKPRNSIPSWLVNNDLNSVTNVLICVCCMTRTQ